MFAPEPQRKTFVGRLRSRVPAVDRLDGLWLWWRFVGRPSSPRRETPGKQPVAVDIDKCYGAETVRLFRRSSRRA